MGIYANGEQSRTFHVQHLAYQSLIIRGPYHLGKAGMVGQGILYHRSRCYRSKVSGFNPIAYKVRIGAPESSEKPGH